MMLLKCTYTKLKIKLVDMQYHKSNCQAAYQGVNIDTMGCPPVRGDNPRALASGLSFIQMDNHGITILYHPFRVKRSFMPKLVRVVQMINSG